MRPRAQAVAVSLLLLTDAVAAEEAVPDEAPGVEVRALSEADVPTRVLTLAEALDRALSDNLDLALSRARHQVAERARSTVQAGLYPGLAFGLGAGRTDGRVQGSFGDLRDVTFSTYAGGGAVVYRANVVSLLKRVLAERATVEAADLDRLDTERRLILQVVGLYEDLVLATVAVQIAEEVVAGSEQFLGVIRARTDAGVGLGADVARSEAKLAADRGHLVEVRKLLKDTSARLALTLRLDQGTLLVPAAGRLEPAVLPAIEAGAGPEGRPDVQAASRRVTEAAQDASSALWNLLAPELRAEVAALEIGDVADELEGRTERRLLLTWNLSPESFGRTRERRAEEEVARLHALSVEEQARAELRRAQVDLEAARESIPQASRGLAAASDTLRLSEARFKAGTAIALEVLDAQEKLAEARFNLARAIVDYNLSQARVLAATGGISKEAFAGRGAP